MLVVGPSGAGKDTLLNAARAHFQGDRRFVFPQRFITRDSQLGEPHAAISNPEFERLDRQGGFFLCWRAYGIGYSIGAEVLEMLGADQIVVLNVSRRVISEARQKWPRTRVIQIIARPEVLRERLLARGRETADAIDERLERASALHLPQAEWLSDLDNSGDLESGVARFTALIFQAAEAQSAERGAG